MTVIGGWLGSGKTTLLNRLLAEATERIAVVVNDVGDINIDAGLIQAEGDNIIELTNGCVCCSIGGSLALTLRDLVALDPPPDRIVVEASGVAEPAQVARFGDRRVVPIDSVVAVADAADIRRRVSDITYGTLARSQLSDADLIVVSKTDLLTPEAAEELLSWIRADWPDISVAASTDTPGWASAILAGTIVHRSVDSEPMRFPGVHTTSFQLPNDIDAEVVRGVLEAAGPAILRVKGFIALPEPSDSIVAIHLAGRRVSIDPVEPGPNVNPGHLVVIGEDQSSVADLAEQLGASVGPGRSC